MAIQPVTTTRQWYSYGNVPFTPTSADDTQKWFLWLWKELLIGNYSGKGGTEGPEGARPAGSRWTVVGSNDGVGNFSSGGPVGDTNNDGVDRWTTRANVIFANSGTGTNHSWIILKSPVATNPNGALGFGQGPMWMLLDNSGDAGTAVLGRAKVMFSREPFTGGTATARPTSPKEFDGAKYLASTLAPSIWTNTTYNVVRFASISVDANGQWYFVTAVSGTQTMESVSCLVENINSDDRDLYRQHASMCYFGHPNALVSRVWTGGSVRQFGVPSPVSNEGTIGSTSGGIVRYQFGMASYQLVNASATGGINGLYSTYRPINLGASVAGMNVEAFGQLLNVDFDNYTVALPLYVLDYGSGYYYFPTATPSQNITNNRPQWRGQLPDAWAVSGQPNVGSSYPSAAAQTHVVTPARLNGESSFLIPMSVQLAL